MPRGNLILKIEKTYRCALSIEEWDGDNEYAFNINLHWSGCGSFATGTLDDVKDIIRERLKKYSTDSSYKADKDAAKWLIEQLDNTNQISLF